MFHEYYRTLQSGNLDQLKDLRGLVDWGTLFFLKATALVAVEADSGVPNDGGGGGPGGKGLQCESSSSSSLILGPVT